MEKLNLGRVASVNDTKRFGFIKHVEDESIFFHFSQAWETLKEGDKVFFSIRDSKQKDGMIEAFAIRKLHPQPNGYNLVIGKFFRATKEVIPFLLEELPKIEISSDQTELKIEKTFDYVIGRTLAVSTTEEDEVFYAKRFKKRGYSRFVKNREAEETNVFTIIINYNNDLGFYEVSAAFFGPSTMPEPWDRRAPEEALQFWRNHALIPHEFFGIQEDTLKDFDPDFFKSFQEIQGGTE